jgi:endonuclease YncB( thermonuclease family)
MKPLSIFLLSLLMAFSVLADKADKSVIYDIKITRVIDGDTVAFEASWLLPPLKPELSIRVYGVDTPEKSFRGACDKEKTLGEIASKFTKDQIAKGKKFQLALIGWDKYGGRVLGDLLIDGHSLREMLIIKGYAREYYGDKKVSWCD